MPYFFKLLGRLILSLCFLVGALVLEVLLAMLLYIYLAANHQTAFGEAVRLARDGLNWAVDGMDAMLPDLSTQAYATLVGELGPKSFLLLVLGLLASGVIRLVALSIAGIRRRRAAAA